MAPRLGLPYTGVHSTLYLPGVSSHERHTKRWSSGDASRRLEADGRGGYGGLLALDRRRAVLGRAGIAAASERIVLGVIGIGPRCKYDLQSMLTQPDVQCVAISDVQASRREAGKSFVDGHYGNKDCRLYRDFRELLARADIDAVLIATGDRWHAPASILAAQAGKDVYSEKPCGLTIADCQSLADTMNHFARVFQAGTQRRSVANFQLAVQLAHSGKLGKLKTLHASVYTPSNDYGWLPAEPEPARDEVDWDMWLGPAPWRPYNHSYVQGGWRGYYDFDSGARLLDWGAHTVDLCQWANQADDTMPVEYEPTPTIRDRPLRQRREAGTRFPARRPLAIVPAGSSIWAPALSGSWAKRAGWKPATAAGSRFIRPR